MLFPFITTLHISCSKQTQISSLSDLDDLNMTNYDLKIINQVLRLTHKILELQ